MAEHSTSSGNNEISICGHSEKKERPNDPEGWVFLGFTPLTFQEKCYNLLFREDL